MSSRLWRAIACVASGVALLPAATAGSAHAAASARAGTAALPRCEAPFTFHRTHFPQGPGEGNRWLSLTPGTALVLTGLAEGDDGKLHPHTITSVVSGVTKVLDRVRTRIVFERDYQDHKLQESELAFEAAERSGRVWNVGEYPEEYAHGSLAGAPDTWIAGLRKARPGIGMLAHPREGTPPYSQGRAPKVGFHDCAQVTRTNQRVCIPKGCVNHVLIIREWAPNDRQGGVQLKFYAPRVGAIRVGQVGAGPSAEKLHLVRHSRLNAAQLRRVDAAVLRQDRRGYHVSPHLYGRTPRARVGCGH
jgi:hypothetical protein